MINRAWQVKPNSSNQDDNIKKQTMNHRLDQTNLTILKYLSEGYTLRQISCTIFLSHVAVVKRIERMKDESGCKNIPELVFYHSDQIKQLKQAS